jgi:cation:H+ antiporter
MEVLPYFIFIIGLIFLVKGADWLISGASSLGRRLGISDLAIGMTVVAFGTSLPELIVSILMRRFANGVVSEAVNSREMQASTYQGLALAGYAFPLPLFRSPTLR